MVEVVLKVRVGVDEGSGVGDGDREGGWSVQQVSDMFCPSCHRDKTL